MSTPIVDVCGVFFDGESWESYLMTFANKTPGYLRAFGPSLARHAGADLQKYEAALAENPVAAVRVLMEAGGLHTTPEEHVADLEAQGVRHQIVHGGSGRLADGTTMNERLASIAARFPDRLQAWAGLDMSSDADPVRELEQCIEDHGMKGASMVHWWGDRDPHDPVCQELYGRAAEMGVPLWIHTGMNFASNRPMAYCTWRDIDLIAGAHPNLVILAGHGGWPWILEGMAVLQRQPNVYFDLSAHRPRYIKKPGSGWEPLLLFGSSTLRHKIMIGSVTWVHRVSIRQLAIDVEELGLGEETARAWLHDNAARVFGLDGEDAA